MGKAYFILFTLGVFLTNSLFSQTINQGEPFLLREKIKPTIHFFTTPFTDNEQALLKFKENNANQLEKVARFGEEHIVSIDVFGAGEKTILPSGDFIYQFGIRSKKAVSINLIFDQFKLASGVFVHLVDLKNSSFDGAYSSLNNNSSSMLGTEILFSDEVIIEVFVPKEKDGLSDLKIGTIVHGFQNINELAKSLNQSGNCQIDVNCPLGDDWINQRNSVVMMVNGGGFCTGALVNNTSNTIIPYFLSARHCGTTPGGWVFRFRYESPEGQTDCGTTTPSVDGPATMNINGASLLANFQASDFTLSLLNTIPDPNWGVYYSGWDRSDNAATGLTGIHHPNGDVKKISQDNSTALSSSFSGILHNSHWKVPSWDYGTTEPGSSGSPLFDQNKRIIGQLQGGNSYCGAATNDLNDDYGKFALSWVGNGTDDSRLSNWLDPQGLNPLFIDGIDPLVPIYTKDAGVANANILLSDVCGDSIQSSFTLFNSGSDTLFNATIEYGFDGIIDQTYLWEDTLLTFQTTEIKLDRIQLTDGVHTFTAIYKNNGTDENSSNDTTNYSITINKTGEPIFIDLFINCYASENYWEVIDEASGKTITGGPYSDNAITPIQDSFCLELECYTFKIHDSFGDGFTFANCENGSARIKTESGEVLTELLASNANFGALYASSFCVKTNDTTIINKTKNVIIYPNPASTLLKIITTKDLYSSIKITSPTGQIIYEDNAFNDQLKLDVLDYANGIYFIELKGNTEVSVQSFMVNK